MHPAVRLHCASAAIDRLRKKKGSNCPLVAELLAFVRRRSFDPIGWSFEYERLATDPIVLPSELDAVAVVGANVAWQLIVDAAIAH